MPPDPLNQAMQNGQVGAGTGYRLRRAINTTPRAHRSVIDSASRRAMRSPSPSARSGLPSNPHELPYQPHYPQFNTPQRPSDEDEIVFAPTGDSNNPDQQAIGGSFLTGPCSYALADFFGPGVNEAEMQSFCVDAQVDITPSPPPADQPFPAVIPNRFPASAPLSAQEQAQADQKREAFLLANGFTSLATNLSKASTSGAPSNSGHVPSVRPVSDEEKARKERRRLEFLDALGFTTQPELPAPASTSEISADADYNLPTEDENDSRCSSGLDDSDGPNEEDHEIVSGTGKARQRAGRIPNTTWKKLKSAFLKLDSDLDQLASDTGRTRENVISLWQNTRSLKRGYLSAWNIYEMYFREHRPQERKRVGNAKATCAECFKKFKETQPNWLELLHTYNDLNKSEKTLTTIQTRNRRFQAHVAALKSLALTASSSSGFETLIVTVGNCIHEDAGLCNVYVSPGAEGFLERFRIDDDMYSGLFRNHVCNLIAQQFEDSFVKELEESPEVVSLLPKKVRPRQQPKREYKEDDGAMPVITEPHDSDYEPVEEEEKGSRGSRAGSVISSVAFGPLKTMIKNGFNRLLDDVKAENLPTGNLRWKTLPEYFMERGVQITGWPETVLFPTQRVKPDASRKTGQGIKDIGVNGTRLLAERLGNPRSSMAAVLVDIDALERGQLPILVEEPTMSGARRFFKGGRCDTAGPKLSKSETNSTTDSSSSDARTRSTMSEPPSDSDDKPLKLQKGTARTSSKENEASSVVDDEDDDNDDEPVKKKGKGTKKATKRKASSDVDDGDEDEDDEPVKKKGKGTKKATKGKTRKAGLSAEVPVKKGRAQREETHVVQEPVEARKKEPVASQKPAPRPIKKPLADPVAAEDNTLAAGGRGLSEAVSPGPIDTATHKAATTAPTLDTATRKAATTAPTLTTRTSIPDGSTSAANVIAPRRNAPRGLTPLNTKPAPAPVDARAAPTRGPLPPDATGRPYVEAPAVVPVPSRGPTPMPAPAHETMSLETRRSDIRLPPNATASHRTQTPTVDQPQSPPKRSAEEEVDSAHKRLRNNTGTATVRPTREKTPLHPPEDLDGPGNYPPSAWDGPFGYNYGPPRRFGGSYYHPSYAPPPNWGRPPGYPNYSEHMSYTEHPHPRQDVHRQDGDDGYGPYPMNAYHQGGPPHFFPPQHYPTDPRQGRTPSEHSSKHSHHKDNQDDA